VVKRGDDGRMELRPDTVPEIPADLAKIIKENG
jgi:hypothetical protein